MRSFIPLVSLVFGSIAACSGGVLAEENGITRKPNILFISVDDLSCALALLW